MTKSELLTAIKHARATGREGLAKSLEFCWADLLAQPDPESKPERVEGSTINGLKYEFNWDDVRLEL
jgi:hypothetical protein